MSEPCLLMFMVPVKLEDALTDWLLESHAEIGFTCVPAFGHGDDPARLTIGERIAGRSKCAQFQVMLETRAAADALIASLGESFPNLHLRWWLTPLLACGHSG